MCTNCFVDDGTLKRSPCEFRREMYNFAVILLGDPLRAGSIYAAASLSVLFSVRILLEAERIWRRNHRIASMSRTGTEVVQSRVVLATAPIFQPEWPPLTTDQWWLTTQLNVDRSVGARVVVVDDAFASWRQDARISDVTPPINHVTSPSPDSRLSRNSPNTTPCLLLTKLFS